MAPFTKLSLSKILVLSDIKAREDYFSQQANFVSLEGRRDDHAEFSTSINGKIFNCSLFEVRQFSYCLNLTYLCTRNKKFSHLFQFLILNQKFWL